MDEAKDRFGDYLLGYNESEYFRGLFLYRGICGPKNYEEAAKCFLKVVKAGDGNVLIPGGLSDGDRSRYWRKFQSSARYHLGFMYYHGQESARITQRLSSFSFKRHLVIARKTW